MGGGVQQWKLRLKLMELGLLCNQLLFAYLRRTFASSLSTQKDQKLVPKPDGPTQTNVKTSKAGNPHLFLAGTVSTPIHLVLLATSTMEPWCVQRTGLDVRTRTASSRSLGHVFYMGPPPPPKRVGCPLGFAFNHTSFVVPDSEDSLPNLGCKGSIPRWELKTGGLNSATQPWAALRSSAKSLTCGLSGNRH